ncbi:MAG: lytic transglycosylase domain-containing protein [Chloroflexi bacterium]|nr:lytic transglycosylase domain-containing protein [Chloroflexota bacterium]
MNKRIGRIIFILVAMAAVTLIVYATPATAAPLQQPDNKGAASTETLSAIWGPTIQQWASYINVLADFYGLDPDFIAAVIKEESNGDSQAVSRVGAVGLMGVMPAGPGLEWRPPADELVNPSTNLRWGVAILSEIVRQSGGDLHAALAAYSGGWSQANRSVPREYAARVLNNYGRAVAARSGVSPDIASQWTLAVEIRMGDVPNESLMVLGDQPISGLHPVGGHVVYAYVDQSGQGYYVKGYAVPVALVAPVGAEATPFGSADSLDIQLQARLDQTTAKISISNPRVITACLPSLSRLRGRASTRWFAPSYCPSWHR